MFSYEFCEIFKKTFLLNISRGCFLSIFFFELSAVISKAFVTVSLYLLAGEGIEPLLFLESSKNLTREINTQIQQQKP